MPKFIEDVKRVYAEKGQLPGGGVRGASTMQTAALYRCQGGENRWLRPCSAGRSGRHSGAGAEGGDRRQGPGIELNLLQRCGAHLASETDIEESLYGGQSSRGKCRQRHQRPHDRLLERGIQNGHYACKTKLVPLMEVANVEKKIPRVDQRGWHRRHPPLY